MTMSVIDIAKRIAENPLVRHSEFGHWMSVYDQDSVTVARELLRLTDDTPADYAWAESVGLDEYDGLCCGSLGDWWVGVECLGKKTRGQVRCLAIALGVELKESE